MAKVTEQDLLDRGFKKIYAEDNSSYWFEFKCTHKLLGVIDICADLYDEIISFYIGWEYISRKLTHANLDLFIRFAEGKEI